MNHEGQVSILAVDDQPENLLALQAIFEKVPIRVVTASSGSEALKYLMSERFAVILMDAFMPIMDGFETARAIRAREKTRHIPIIFLTATHKDSFHTEIGYDVGAVDYIFKPPEPDILRAKVNVFVELFVKSEALVQQSQELLAYKVDLEKSVAKLKEYNQELQKLATIVQYSDDAIISKDLEGVVQSWNHGAELIYGYTAREMIGRTTDVLKPPDKQGEEQELLRRVTLGERIDHFETVRVRKDGRQIDVWLSISPIKDADGVVVGTSRIARDISERKLFEDALLESKEELEILNRALTEAKDQALVASQMKSEFVANMSHEIRTPMNGIIGMCNTLMKSVLTEQQKECATAIREAGSTLLSIINDVLDFSKIEAGKLDLETMEFDIVNIVEGSCQLLAAQSKAKRLSLMSYIDPTVPRLLSGDSERLKQILINLIGNAIKFTAAGEVVVKATVVSEQDGIAMVELSVIDQGIGLSAYEQDRIFQPFAQADGSISRRFGGSGLGLSICTHLVQLMKGRVSLKSAKGEGSTFTCLVPLPVVRRAEPPAVPEGLKGVSVLIVDDHSMARSILSDYIRSWGMQVAAAASGKAAVELLLSAAASENPFSVALIDLTMAGIDGIELARIIRESQSLRETRLILLTSFNPIRKGDSSGSLFNGYLRKPVRQSQLLNCIAEVVVGSPGAESGDDVRATVRQGEKLAGGGLILVADDYGINRQVLKMYLDELGLEHHMAVDGLEAIDLSKRNQYSLILMDCQMPEMDGFAATAEIRRRERETGRHTPIVALTAYAMAGDRDRCIAAGMDDYLSKPIDEEQLIAVLQKWLPSMSEKCAPASLPPNTEGAADAGALLNLSKLEQRLGSANARVLINTFLDESGQDMAMMKDALARHDSKRLADLLHSFIGVCAIVCTERLHASCRRAEQSVQAGCWEETTRLLIELEECFELTRVELASLVGLQRCDRAAN